MSFRRFLAGPVSFGLTAGLAIVALMQEGFSLDPFPMLALIAWGGALALTAVTLKIGWPVLHASAAGLLLVATFSLVDTSWWALSLTAAVGTMAMARFASVGLVSRWISLAVGVMAVVGVGTLAWWLIGGTASLGGDEASAAEATVAFAGLAVVAALAFWPRSDEEEA